MTNKTSQIFESYVPVYDVIPESWEDGRIILVEQLKKLANAVNVREIGFFLDEELISGKQLFPSLTTANDQAFRTILRKVIDFGPIAIGVNSRPHGVLVDLNFTLIELWGSATNSATLTGTPINQPNITYDSVNINITASAAFDRCLAFFEFCQEI